MIQKNPKPYPTPYERPTVSLQLVNINKKEAHLTGNGGVPAAPDAQSEGGRAYGATGEGRGGEYGGGGYVGGADHPEALDGGRSGSAGWGDGGFRFRGVENVRLDELGHEKLLEGFEQGIKIDTGAEMYVQNQWRSQIFKY